VCYETAPEGLSSMCTSCNNAFLCQACVASWRATCLSRNKPVTCPKCRATLEAPPNQHLRWAQHATMPGFMLPVLVGLHERFNWLTPRKAVVVATVALVYALPFLFFIFCMSRLGRSTLRKILNALLFVTSVLVMGFSGILFHGIMNRFLLA
jgi:hypothetical protein